MFEAWSNPKIWRFNKRNDEKNSDKSLLTRPEPLEATLFLETFIFQKKYIASVTIVFVEVSN